MLEGKKQPCFIVVTGGVISGLGKGIAAASLGKLLVNAGLKVVPIKCEGYLNIDPGTMNPLEHGEVFVLDDGEEADMDFGHYERMLNIRCKASWNITMGKIYLRLFERERRGDFLGKTVQMIPHVTDEIKARWHAIAQDTQADVVLIEIGGTVGDIESEMFVEAARQLKRDPKFGNVVYVHLTYVPVPGHLGEPKTKPTQQSVSLLRERGIVPDIIVARSELPVSDSIKQKIALFCDVDSHAVISCEDLATVYDIPILFERQGVLQLLAKQVGLSQTPDLEQWSALVERVKNPQHGVHIAICGKYTALEDSYASIRESLVHAGAHADARVTLSWIDTESLSDSYDDAKQKLDAMLHDADAIIVPGGFGSRGITGKIHTIRFAREHRIPFLGICYGLQLAVVEFAQTLCGLHDAHTTEVNPDASHPVVTMLPGQHNVVAKGGTMRLGLCEAIVEDASVIAHLYNDTRVNERHRHRYEVNPAYHEMLRSNGLVLSGLSPDRQLVEFIELPSQVHPYFVATQSHPELLSSLEKPAPLFLGLVRAALETKQGVSVPVIRNP